MLPEEQVRVLIFLSVIAAVYILAASVLVRLLLNRFNIVRLRKSRLLVWTRCVILGCAALGVLCFAYGYFVEPYWLEVRRIKIQSAKLPVGSEPLRIVHISDVHSDPQPRLETRLPTVIAAEKPDLIVYSGDSINSRDGLPVFRECLMSIAKIAPTFVVKGNWDSVQQLFNDTGAIELQGDTKTIKIKNVQLSLTGFSAYESTRLEDALPNLNGNDFTIFINHYPDDIEEVAEYNNVDLYCAGHTHGGQIALPFYGALITLSKFGKKYEAGTYRVGNTWLNVNRGVGMEGGHAPRVRFWARPEVSVIEAVPQ